MTNEANIRPLVENIPSRDGEISAVASAHAPFIYFDNTTSFGFNNGIASVTLDAVRFVPTATGIVHDRVMVAHLRMSLQAAKALRATLDSVILAAVSKPPQAASH